MGGLINVGVAYYAQWKLSHDDLGELSGELEEETGMTELPRHRVFGFGPDVTVPVVVKEKFLCSLNGRYLWETGARTTLQGRTLVVGITFPIPSVPL